MKRRRDYDERTDPRLRDGSVPLNVRLPIELNQRLRLVLAMQMPKKGAMQRVIWDALDAFLPPLPRRRR